MTKTNDYEPTKAEKRLLEVLLNPESFSMNVKDRCTAADIAKDTYYKAMGKKGFTDLLNSLTMDLLKGKVNDVVNATYRFATSDSKCASDRKVLLTMVGLYTDKVETTGETTVNNKVDFSGLSTEEIRKLLDK